LNGHRSCAAVTPQRCGVEDRDQLEGTAAICVAFPSKTGAAASIFTSDYALVGRINALF
jgi:hypothetical protein